MKMTQSSLQGQAGEGEGYIQASSQTITVLLMLCVSRLKAVMLISALVPISEHA